MKMFSVLLLVWLLSACSSGSGGLASLSTCSTGALFSEPVMNVDDLRGIVPLGNLNPSSHVFPTPHLYFYIQPESDTDDTPRAADVFAPADLTITSITSQEYLSESPPYTDYSLTFQPCNEVEGYFNHLLSLSQRVETLLGDTESSACESYETGGASYRRCSYQVSILMSAGSLVGVAGGRAGKLALDFGLRDSRINALDYANPDRLETEVDGFDDEHVVCALDYYDATNYTLFADLLGSYDGTEARTVTPVCGSVELDVAGTLQGRWYADLASGASPEDPHLALVPDNVDPGIMVFSVGESVDTLDFGTYRFIPVSESLVNPLFSAVADDTVSCFEVDELSDQIILVQLMDAETLAIEAVAGNSCGVGPWSISAGATFFYR